MDTQGEKTRHAAVGQDGFDGPSKKNVLIAFVFAHQYTETLMNVGRSKVRMAVRRRYDKTT